jgi:hypothetical protein
MSVEISKEIWDELKRYINVVDREEAADALINVLIDNDVGADEIRDAFKSEPEVKQALTSYIRDHNGEEAYDEDENEDDEDNYNQEDDY